MNFLSMEYFLVIAGERSISRAAATLFVTQQALSEHVKKLEAELGTDLLKRERPLTLTEAGERFAAGAREILAAHNRMLQDITAMAERQQNKLRIGVSTFDTPPFLPGLLALYSEKYPQYETEVVKMLVSDITHSISGVDLYISFLPLNPGLEHTFLLEHDPTVVVVDRKLLANTYRDRWEALEQRLLETEDLSLLKELPFILLYDKNGFLSRDLEHILKHYGMSPMVGFKSENLDLNAMMCARGRGALLMPQDCARRKFKLYAIEPENDLRMYTVKTPGMISALAISYVKGKKLNHAERCFIELARQVVHEHLP